MQVKANVYNSCIYDDIQDIRMFSSLSGVKLILRKSSYLNILGTNSEKPNYTELTSYFKAWRSVVVLSFF